ncbi:multiprotein bridging factor type, putative [Theileria equi strain WA]|uniref:Multiprotein bridging factor type, putative n=1 Tax=Theileria equi strain WA TaxID=1537102 RepID=L1LGL1_THEEQ|nr:multiprotein bridging factor type, putative [Theileria equi strain WA]EKX74419.1 multiprotein bridging factor type, putative [Theileria equi strain WA]|eukprot:XP_004833871.1 multiprotein bridging factor type, putative [Theileria equi strain WA]
MMASYQDWKPVVWVKNESVKGPNKEAALNKARRSGVELETQKKFLGGQNKATKGFIPGNAAKIENETECFKVERISFAFRTALQKARMDKKMTQIQLARAINESETTIKEYENGTGIPNGQIVQKLNRALGVRLPPAKEQKPKGLE